MPCAAKGVLVRCLLPQDNPAMRAFVYPMLRDDFQMVETYQVGRWARGGGGGEPTILRLFFNPLFVTHTHTPVSFAPPAAGGSSCLGSTNSWYWAFLGLHGAGAF
jgi:hypothetical protein